MTRIELYYNYKCNTRVSKRVGLSQCHSKRFDCQITIRNYKEIIYYCIRISESHALRKFLSLGGP